MAKKQNVEVVIIGEKVWGMPHKMVMATLSVAKQKMKKDNVNVIYAVSKEDTYIMRKDVFDNSDAFEKAIKDWETKGFKCHVNRKKEVK